MHRLVIALVTLIGLTAAAFVAGYLLLFSASTDRAASLAPANTAFYINLYLQPSAGQQMNLSGLIGRLPGFADEASLDEKVDQVVQNLLSGTGIDYRQHLKPWLGDQIAVAGWPGSEGATDARATIIAEVTDPDAARAAIAGFVSQSGATLRTESYAGVDLQVADTGAYAFVGDMVVIGENADSIHAVLDVDGGADSLAQRADFVATMDGLEPDHLASAFIDLAALGEAAGVGGQVSGMSTAGAVLVAEQDGLRISATAPFDREEATPSAAAGFALGGEPSSLVDWMPSDTVAETVVFGLRQTLEGAEAAIGAAPEGEEIASALDTARALAALALGIDLDADLLPLLDREVAVAVAGIGATGLPSGQILLRPSDPAAATDALDRLASALAGVGATQSTESLDEVDVTILSMPDTGEVAYAEVDGIVIIGFGVEDVSAAIDAHASGDSLGASDRYTRTFEVAGTRAGTEAYVDVGAVVELLGDPAELPEDARDILLQVGTLGITAPSRNDQVEFHAVLTVDP